MKCNVPKWPKVSVCNLEGAYVTLDKCMQARRCLGGTKKCLSEPE